MIGLPLPSLIITYRYRRLYFQTLNLEKFLIGLVEMNFKVTGYLIWYSTIILNTNTIILNYSSAATVIRRNNDLLVKKRLQIQPFSRYCAIGIAYWGHEFDLSGSREVIGHSILRPFPIGGFL